MLKFLRAIWHFIIRKHSVAKLMKRLEKTQDTLVKRAAEHAKRSIKLRTEATNEEKTADKASLAADRLKDLLA